MREQLDIEANYDWRFWAGAVVVGVGAVASLLTMVAGGWPPDLLFASSTVFFTVALLRALAVNPRSVSFGAYIEVRRFVLPPKRIDYADVRDIGLEAIKTRKGSIRTLAMTNAEAIHSALDAVIESGLIREAQLERRLAYHELAVMNAFLAGALPLFIGGSILKLVGYVGYLWTNVALAIAVGVGVAVYFYSRRRFENLSAPPPAA